MTHEQIESAIGRLRELSEKCSIYTSTQVINAVTDGPWVGDLIAILQQADPDTHMELPVDADGVPIHVGDELCGYGYPNGGVRCYAIVNERTILVQGDPSAYKDWLLWDAANCRHYHKPTVEELLFEFGKICQDGYDIGNNIHEYAAKLREVINGD